MNSPFPLVKLEEVAEIRLGTQVPRKGAPAAGIATPYLRAANVQRGRVDLTDLKTMGVSESTIERLELVPDDVLFVEGNSREEVGRAAVWPGREETTIIQNSIVRARVRTADLLPAFLVAWFNSKPGRQYILEQATSTSGSLWHIGVGKLAGAPLPLPPANVQQQLVDELNEGLETSRIIRREADALREQAEAELEATLGIN